MPSLEAEAILREKGGSLTPESLGRLVTRATGSEEEGQMAAARRVLELERQRTRDGG